MVSKLGAAFQGLHQRQRVCMAEAGAGRQPLGGAGNLAVQAFEQVVQVGCRGFPFHIGSGCQNDFTARLAGDAFHQGVDIEVFRFHIIQRGELASQAVVQPAVGAAAFNGNDVRSLFHHADERAVPLFIPAGGAGFAGGAEKAAYGARGDVFSRLADGAGNGFRLSHVALEHPQGHALRAAGADARKLFKGGYQFKYGKGIVQIIHERGVVRKWAGPVAAGATGWRECPRTLRRAGMERD